MTNVSRTENVVAGEKVENNEQVKPEEKKLDKEPDKESDGHSRTLNIILGVSLGLIALAMSMIAITVCLICCRRHQLHVVQTAPSDSSSSAPVETKVVTVQPARPVANPRSLEKMK